MISLLLLISTTGSSFAAESAGKSPTPNPCPEVKVLEPQVRSCQDNARVLTVAKECYRSVMDHWAAESAAGKAAKASNSQSADFLLAKKDLKRADRKMKKLISQTKKRVRLFSRYGKLLKKDSGSATACYTENQQAIRKMVKSMKHSMAEGRKAKKEIHKMAKLTRRRGSELGTAGAVSVGKPARAKRTIASGAPKIKNLTRESPPSTITGIRRQADNGAGLKEPESMGSQSFFNELFR